MYRILFEQANELDKEMTAARAKLWEYLKGKKLFNLPFQIEYPIDQINADFYCDPLKLAIRIDKDDQELNKQKFSDAWNRSSNRDIKLLHIEERDIEINIDEVIESIKWECALRHLELDGPIYE